MAVKPGIETEGRNRLVLMLQSLVALQPADEQRIRRLPMRVERVAKGQVFVAEGDRPNDCTVVLEGMVCRFKYHRDGRRQILSLHYAGALPDLQSLYLRRMDHSLSALTPAWLGFIPHHAVQEQIDRHKSVRDALWRESLVEAACFREWVLGIGQRRAYERIAHLFCEMAVNARSVQLNRGTSFPMPLTQVDLADATGLTPVHVNRTVAKLRDMKLISLRGRMLTILDWERLVEAGGFDSGYLHRQLQ